MHHQRCNSVWNFFARSYFCLKKSVHLDEPVSKIIIPMPLIYLVPIEDYLEKHKIPKITTLYLWDFLKFRDSLTELKNVPVVKTSRMSLSGFFLEFNNLISSYVVCLFVFTFSRFRVLGIKNLKQNQPLTKKVCAMPFAALSGSQQAFYFQMPNYYHKCTVYMISNILIVISWALKTK